MLLGRRAVLLTLPGRTDAEQHFGAGQLTRTVAITFGTVSRKDRERHHRHETK